MENTLSNGNDIKATNYFVMLEEIIQYIRKENIKIGEKLPNENILSEDLHINRSTLREALRVLEAFGVIASKRGAGNVYVCDLEIGLMNLYMISSILLDRKSSEPSYLRAIIEAAAVEEFISNATEYDFFMLEMIYRVQMKKTDRRTPLYMEAHIQFHDQIMKYHTNDTFKQIAHSAIRLIDTTRVEQLQAEATTHENLLNVIKKKDIPGAKRLIISHILLPGEITDA